MTEKMELLVHSIVSLVRLLKLPFIEHMTDGLCYADLFRCESIGPASRMLKPHWVMVVLDHLLFFKGRDLQNKLDQFQG